MTLTGKVTSIHAGSRFVDGLRRVTVSISGDNGKSYQPLADLTVRSEELELEGDVTVSITPVPVAADPVYFRPKGTEVAVASDDIPF